MGRPAYKITDADYSDAVIYLLEQYKFSGSYYKLSKSNNAEELQQWCDEYLDEEQFKKLKQVIWAKRKRTKDAMKSLKPKQITISRKAWKHLSDLSKKDGMSYSELLENYLEVLNESTSVSRKRLLEKGTL